VVIERENPLRLMESRNSETKVRKNTFNDNHIKQGLIEEERYQILDGAAAKAREIIEQSKKEARRIIENAKAEKQKIEKTAFEKGYKEGFEAGKKEQEVIWKRYLAELNDTKKELQNRNALFIQHLEKECIKLSMAIAEKILGRAIQIDTEYLLDLIKRGLKEAGEEKEALIRISEQDYDKVTSMISKLEKGQYSITLMKDPTLSSGDCIIIGPNYEIDVGIHTQVENIAEALRKLEVI